MVANAILSASIERGFQFTFTDLTASQSIVSGDVIQIGESLLAIAVEKAKGATLRAAEIAAGSIASPDRCACLFVHEDVKITCLGTDVIAAGNRLFYDVANTRVTLVATGNIFCGYAVEASANDVTTVQMHFDGRLGGIAQASGGITVGSVATKIIATTQLEALLDTIENTLFAMKTGDIILNVALIVGTAAGSVCVVTIGTDVDLDGTTKDVDSLLKAGNANATGIQEAMDVAATHRGADLAAGPFVCDDDGNVTISSSTDQSSSSFVGSCVLTYIPGSN